MYEANAYLWCIQNDVCLCGATGMKGVWLRNANLWCGICTCAAQYLMCVIACIVERSLWYEGHVGGLGVYVCIHDTVCRYVVCVHVGMQYVSPYK